MKSKVKKDNPITPAHYGGVSNPYEAIKVIDAWDLPFTLGNTVKYISRAGKKDPTKNIEDLRKAAWYLNHEIQKLEKVKETEAQKKLGKKIIKEYKKSKK